MCLHSSVSHWNVLCTLHLLHEYKSHLSHFEEEQCTTNAYFWDQEKKYNLWRTFKFYLCFSQIETRVYLLVLTVHWNYKVGWLNFHAFLPLYFHATTVELVASWICSFLNWCCLQHTASYGYKVSLPSLPHSYNFLLLASTQAAIFITVLSVKLCLKKIMTSS